MAMKQDDRIVRDVIERYGDTIELRETPYVIIEILRQFGPEIGSSPAADCLPPGGPPKAFDPDEIMQQIRAHLAEIERLTGLLHSARNRSEG